jgi:cystathionine beta-lyase
VQTPIYPPFLNSVRNTNRSLIECPLLASKSSAAIDMAGLRAAITPNTRMLLLCNPHNPTGIVFSRTDLEAIGEIAEAHDLIVVADEIHADLVFEGPHIPFESLGSACAKRTITINSATKAFNIAGLRAGMMHFGSPDMLDMFRRAFPDRLLGQVSGIGMQATIAAWTEGQEWLDRVLVQLRQNRETLADTLRRELPDMEFRSPAATYLQWLDCSKLGLGMSPDEFFLQRAKVALNGGQHFGDGYSECVRLNFGTSPAILSEILARIVDAVRSARA